MPIASPIGPFEQAEAAAITLKERLGDDLGTAVVLGSGWAAAADALGSVRAQMPLSDLPGMPSPTVVGHSGLMYAIESGSSAALIIGGRNHLYEGHSESTVVHTVRTAIAAGCHTIVLTNAAGSLDLDLQPGQPVLISDQLNLTGASPMAGAAPPERYPGRFCDVSNIYTPRLREIARSVDPTLPEGVYAGLLGGAYETPAEVRMLKVLGADLVGMSTVLEAIAAAHLGAQVAGISLVTNLGSGLGGELSHGEVLDVAKGATGRMVELIGAIIEGAG